jgi:SAM-dependent methyltransferase
MLSDVFLDNGNRVVAVEPNVEMREMCIGLHEGASWFEVVNGTAEATGLADSSVEMVAVGRAFHWFDVERAAVEFRRILKPGGWFASVAFGRSQTGREENEAFEQILRRFTADHVSTHIAYELYGRIKDLFARDYHHEEIVGTMTLDWEELYGISMSFSHSPLSGDPRHEPFEQDLRAYFDRYAADGRVIWQTRCWINVGRFAV